MFKTSVRKSVSLVIVAVILLSSVLLAGCSPEPYHGDQHYLGFFLFIQQM